MKKTYVYDVVTGANALDDALVLQLKLNSLLNCGGFELRKCLYICNQLLQVLPQDHLQIPVFLEESQQPHVSILGLHWSSNSYNMTYKFEKLPKHMTLMDC
ncbi:hypothetical protein J6590_060787 [Homalodisca vitripennis]|nr:hypothetical protein J6590_060787 [Homalodisca vitripennis]